MAFLLPVKGDDLFCLDPGLQLRLGPFQAGRVFILGFGPALQTGQDDLVGGRLQFDLQLRRLFQDLRYGSAAGHKPEEEVLAGLFQVLLHILAVLLLHGPLPLLLLDLVPDLVDLLYQLRGADGLGQEPGDAQVDGLPGVAEFRVARQDDDLGLRIVPAQLPGKLQTVHEGHLDVRYDNIRPCLVDQRQGQLPVGGLPSEFIAVRLPVYSFDSFPDDVFVLHKKYLQQCCYLPFPAVSKSVYGKLTVVSVRSQK